MRDNNMKLDQFTEAYIQAMLWATTDNTTEQGGNPLDDNYTIHDISKEALVKIIADCEKFQGENIDDIMTIPDWYGAADSSGMDHYTGLECAGHDFFFTRNGHGVGFWEREYLTKDQQDRLTKNSHEFGEMDAYVGDDGLIYV